MIGIYTYSQYTSINEGGAAIKSSRSIREDEFPATLDSIKSILLPLLGTEGEEEYLVIGSIGKKANPEDVSGDLDLGFEWEVSAKKYGSSRPPVLHL